VAGPVVPAFAFMLTIAGNNTKIKASIFFIERSTARPRAYAIAPADPIPSLS
jgi:hypothetical protein